MMSRSLRRILPPLLLLTTLAGCASAIPQTVRKAPRPEVPITAARTQPQAYLGQTVRWGGTILKVRNLAQSTEIEVLARPLGASGEPREDAPGTARFIAVFAGFRDPAEYPEKRLLTVTGVLQKVRSGKVGDYSYPYPVVAVSAAYLWPLPDPYYPAVLGPYPHWYGPYRPYGPYGPWWW